MPTAFEEVHLEVTSHCNFHCSFCPLPVSGRPRAEMPLVQALRALEEIAGQRLAPQVAYHLMGEPLLYPHLPEVMRRARELGLTNRVVSNGYLLAKTKPRQALRHCQILDISLRASDEQEFAELSPRGSFREYLDGIKEFLARRSELGSFQVRLRTFCSPGLGQVLRAAGVDLAEADLGGEAKTWLDLAPDLSLIIESCLDWRGRDKRFPARPFAACREFDQGFAVLADGSLTACCWDYEGRNALGNFIHDGGITKVLNGERAQRFRGHFQRKRPPTQFCAQCLGRPSLPKYLAYQGAVLLGRR